MSEKIRASEVSLQLVSSPDSSIPGSQITWDSNSEWQLSSGGEVIRFKGAELSPSASEDGVLEVHLINDPSNRWYKMPLSIGSDKGRIFDKVRKTNTTASIYNNLGNLTLFPV